jgi:hypothetical protein
LGLDGILPWNAWGDPRSTVGPDGYLDLLDGKTDKIIHIFAIPKWAKVNGVWKLVVSPDEVVVMPVRETVWHGAQTRDAEVKLEVIVQSNYVWDPFQNGLYTFYGRRTKAIEVKALELAQGMFEALTAEGELADPCYRIRYAEHVSQLPHRKGRKDVDPRHPTGVTVGTEADQAELDQEAINRDRRQDRDSENQVAGQTQAPAVSDPDDGTTMNGPEGSPGAVVVGPPVIPPGPTPAPAGPVTGKFQIPIDLK